MHNLLPIQFIEYYHFCLYSASKFLLQLKQGSQMNIEFSASDNDDDLDYSAIGSRIRKHRKSVGMSQEQLAEAVGISTTHISHIETGHTKLSLSVFVRIASVLSISTDELLCDYGEPDRTILLGSIQNRLEKCSQTELAVISDIVETAAASLRKNYAPLQ